MLIPRPEDRPTVPLWPDAGQALGIGRSASYEAARRGEIPTIRLGARVVVPTAALRRMLLLDDPKGSDAA
jgi:hypothetical protein